MRAEDAATKRYLQTARNDRRRRLYGPIGAPSLGHTWSMSNPREFKPACARRPYRRTGASNMTDDPTRAKASGRPRRKHLGAAIRLAVGHRTRRQLSRIGILTSSRRHARVRASAEVSSRWFDRTESRRNLHFRLANGGESDRRGKQPSCGGVATDVPEQIGFARAACPTSPNSPLRQVASVDNRPQWPSDRPATGRR